MGGDGAAAVTAAVAAAVTGTALAATLGGATPLALTGAVDGRSTGLGSRATVIDGADDDATYALSCSSDMSIQLSGAASTRVADATTLALTVSFDVGMRGWAAAPISQQRATIRDKLQQ